MKEKLKQWNSGVTLSLNRFTQSILAAAAILMPATLAAPTQTFSERLMANFQPSLNQTLGNSISQKTPTLSFAATESLGGYLQIGDALGRRSRPNVGEMSLVPDDTTTNWGPGMDLPYSPQHLLKTDLAGLDPTFSGDGLSQFISNNTFSPAAGVAL